MPGHEHRFSFIVTDGNGIESFDFIEFALLGRDQNEVCAVKFEPRFHEVEYDQDCFETVPLVNVTKQPLLSEWKVDIHFRMAWSLLDSSMTGTPSLKIYDEGQDLGLGLSRMTVFDWTLSSQLELGALVLRDETLPHGTVEEFNKSLNTRKNSFESILINDL